MFVRSKNSRVQDIYLLAKNHYGDYINRESWSERARILLANANGVELEYFTFEDTAQTIMCDCLTHFNHRAFNGILKDLSPEINFELGRKVPHADYWRQLTYALLSQIGLIERDDLKIEFATIDPLIATMLSV